MKISEYTVLNMTLAWRARYRFFARTHSGRSDDFYWKDSDNDKASFLLISLKPENTTDEA